MPLEACPPVKLVESRYRTAALAHGVFEVARDIGAKLIVCWSQNGGTARYLSQNNFRVPIIAYSSDDRATRRMALLYGVRAIHAQPPASGRLLDWFTRVDSDVLRRGLAALGDPIVLLAGRPLGQVKSTSTITVRNIGDEVPEAASDAFER